MPNGEGIADPRYKSADAWRAFLLGLLSGAIDKSVAPFGDISRLIIEVDAEAGYIILATPEGNYKVEITVSF